MKTIYGYNAGPSENAGYLLAQAITEDGVMLRVRHHCPTEADMPKGLGMDGESLWWHDVYEKACPDGYECEFVPEKEAKKHLGLTRALYLWQQSMNAVADKRDKPSSIAITKGPIEECK